MNKIKLHHLVIQVESKSFQSSEVCRKNLNKNTWKIRYGPWTRKSFTMAPSAARNVRFMASPGTILAADKSRVISYRRCRPFWNLIYDRLKVMHSKRPAEWWMESSIRADVDGDVSRLHRSENSNWSINGGKGGRVLFLGCGRVRILLDEKNLLKIRFLSGEISISIGVVLWKLVCVCGFFFGFGYVSLTVEIFLDALLHFCVCIKVVFLTMN